MKITKPDGVSINLTQSNFLTAGGEGKIYVIRDKAFKVYQNSKKVIPRTKITELLRIPITNVIKPEGHIMDSITHIPIGYQMDFVSNTTQVCAVFTRAYKDQNHISSETIVKLITNIRDIVHKIHQAGVLIVDFNELNVLVSKHDYTTPYFIDVDSYQTKSSSATAIMESVRDRHCNLKFSEGTDWFAFAIMTMQLMIGIHPYKGRHPDVKTLDNRMQENISIFNPSVSIPHACEPIENIPPNLRSWLKQVLEKGDRSSPPMDNITANKSFKLGVMLSTNEGVRLIKLCDFGVDITYITDDMVILQSKVIFNIVNNETIKFGKHKPEGLIIGLGVTKITKFIGEDGLSNFEFMIYLKGCRIICKQVIVADAGFMIGNNFYFKINDKVFIVTVNEKEGFITSTHVTNVMPMATRIFHGILIQDCLGTSMITVFEGKTVYTFSLDVVLGKRVLPYKIINAYYENGVAAIVYQEGNIYKRAMLRINALINQSTELFALYEVDKTFISIAVKQNGVAVFTDQDGNAVITSKFIGDNRAKIINSDVLDGERLGVFQNKVVVIRSSEVFEVVVTK